MANQGKTEAPTCNYQDNWIDKHKEQTSKDFKLTLLDNLVFTDLICCKYLVGVLNTIF